MRLRRARRPWAGRVDELEPRLVWLLGSPRSGSTWLLNLLGAAPRVLTIDEPAIGSHLALLVGGQLSMRARDVPADRLRVNDVRAGSDDYLFSQRYADAWRGPARDLVLARLHAQVVEQCADRGVTDPLVVIKEPHGSLGADLLGSLLPASRLLFLLRDGRDVLDSEVDAGTAGSWASWATEGFVTADVDRAGFLRDRAHLWVLRTRVVQAAVDAHAPELCHRLRYEDLLDDTVGHLAALDAWLDLGLGERVSEVAEAGRVDRQPAAARGPGRFIRAAAPGRWRDHLSVDEVAMVDQIMGPTLAEQGYA